jgi:diguanylate cyclase (GGDEF)-like protein
MKSGFLNSRFSNDDDRLTASLLTKFILATLFTYAIVILAGALWADWNLITITLIGVFSLFFPIGFLLSGHLQTGSIFIVISILVTTTIIAMVGQGIHDLAILAYPVMIVLAGLVMKRVSFYISAFLSLVAMGFLIFGEYYRVFIPTPVEMPGSADFFVVAAIWLVAVFSVDLLSENIRSSFRKARLEITNHQSVESQLRHQKNHDALTGIFNRSFFEEELARQQANPDYPVSFIVADVDNLKMTNDSHGHAAGDEVLRNTAIILEAVFRNGDVLARIGGDEFAILLPKTDAVIVEHIKNRIYSKVTEFNLTSNTYPVEISVGVSTAKGGSLKDSLVIADQHMYEEKARRKSKKLSTMTEKV